MGGRSCSNNTECDTGETCSANRCVTSSGFQNNVPPSSPASVDEDDDEAVGDRIDYAATMEQAYDNLQTMLGDDGIKSITSETKKLVNQQKDLMKTLNSMAPVLNTAKETLSGMDLPNIGEMGNLLKKLNPLLQRVEDALADSQYIEELLISAPMDSLLYQKELLDVQRTLQTQQRALINSKNELATLMGLLPNQKFTLADNDTYLTNLKMDIQTIEEIALLSRPELMESRYQKRISREGILFS